MRQGLEGRRSRSEGMERQRNPEKPDGFRGSGNRAARNIRGGGLQNPEHRKAVVIGNGSLSIPLCRLFDYGDDVFGFKNKVVFAVDFNLSAGVFVVHNPLFGLDCNLFFIRSDCNYNGDLGFFLRRVGNNNSAGGF